MNSVEYYRLFNQVVDEFFRELIEIFPEENKIKVQHNLFQTMCQANFKKPCNDFILGSVQYLEKIAMRDETFFKGEDKPDLLKSMNFERIWTDTLSSVTKDAIWRYIKSFFSIGVNVIQVPENAMVYINYIISN
jgi:hypothetical protein